MSISDYIKSADFKTEKHVPVIEAPRKADSGKTFMVSVIVGKEISHPNTTEHFIESLVLYFKAEGTKAAIELGRAAFSAHGASSEGANQGVVYTEPVAQFAINLTKSGTLTAISYCNIHGLWESSVEITIQ